MQPQRDLAITLRSIPYEERHRIVTALTLDHGKVSAMAKNAVQSRRFGGSLDLFTASEWFFTVKQGTELLHLTEAHIRKSFDHLRRNFKYLALASTLNELMLKIAPQNEACPELFRLHSNALNTLHENADKEGYEIVFLNAYLVKLLQWNGNQPQLHQCLNCEISLDQVATQSTNDGLVYGVISSAGWVCSDCRTKTSLHLQGWVIRLTTRVIQELQENLATPIRHVFERQSLPSTAQDQQDLFKFLEALFAFHMPGFEVHSNGEAPLKSLRFLGLESNLQPPIKMPR